MSSESDATREERMPDGGVRGADDDEVRGSDDEVRGSDDEVRGSDDEARGSDGEVRGGGDATRADGDAGRPTGGGDTYTHVPAGMEDPRGADASAAQDGLGRRGWILVGVVFLGTIVCPAIVYLYPAVLADHVPFRFAMLVVPFLPAVLLGATAVWAMAARRD